MAGLHITVDINLDPEAEIEPSLLGEDGLPNEEGLIESLRAFIAENGTDDTDSVSVAWSFSTEEDEDEA